MPQQGGHALKEAAACGDPMQEQAPGKSCGLWREAQARAGFLAGPVTHGGPALEQSVPERLHPMGRAHAQTVPEGLYPVGRAHAGAEGKCEKEGAAERNCCGLTMTPIPLPHLGPGRGGRRVGNEAVKLSLGRNRGGGKVVLVLSFFFLTILLYF